MSFRALSRCAGLAALALLGAGCGRGGVELTLRNRSATPLDAVVVYTSGHRYEVGALPPGGARVLRVEAEGESHVEVEHGAPRPRRLRIDTYFERGYRGSIAADLTPDTVLSVVSRVH